MRPGMGVRPRGSMPAAWAGRERAARGPAAVIRSPSMTTAASGTGAAPVPSIRGAPVRTRAMAGASYLDFSRRGAPSGILDQLRQHRLGLEVGFRDPPRRLGVSPVVRVDRLERGEDLVEGREREQPLAG